MTDLDWYQIIWAFLAGVMVMNTVWMVVIMMDRRKGQ